MSDDVRRPTSRTCARCVELAREGLADGDEPFGSVLVDAAGVVRFEDRNRVKDGDETRHPEFEIAQWSATHLTPRSAPAATVYTSGEHCPMCSAAHALDGARPDRLRRLVGAAGRVAGRAWGVPPGAGRGRCRSTTWPPAYPSTARRPSWPDEMHELHRSSSG